MSALKDLVSEYIQYTIDTDTVLNSYVPNSHLGVVFSEVIEFIGYYDCNEHTDIFSTIDFESMVRDVFKDTQLTDDNVHEAYQRLRERDNRLRNIMKLLMIMHDELMSKRVERNSDAIYREFLN